jgi:hypothetical protein
MVWLCIGFGFVIGIIGLSDTARDYTLYFTVTYTLVYSHVFTSRCLVAASNDGHSPSSGFPNYIRPQLPASRCNSPQRLNHSVRLTHSPTNLVNNWRPRLAAISHQLPTLLTAVSRLPRNRRCTSLYSLHTTTQKTPHSTVHYWVTWLSLGPRREHHLCYCLRSLPNSGHCLQIHYLTVILHATLCSPSRNIQTVNSVNVQTQFNRCSLHI